MYALGIKLLCMLCDVATALQRSALLLQMV